MQSVQSLLTPLRLWGLEVRKWVLFKLNEFKILVHVGPENVAHQEHYHYYHQSYMKE